MRHQFAVQSLSSAFINIAQTIHRVHGDATLALAASLPVKSSRPALQMSIAADGRGVAAPWAGHASSQFTRQSTAGMTRRAGGSISQSEDLTSFLIYQNTSSYRGDPPGPPHFQGRFTAVAHLATAVGPPPFHAASRLVQEMDETVEVHNLQRGSLILPADELRDGHDVVPMAGQSAIKGSKSVPTSAFHRYWTAGGREMVSIRLASRLADRGPAHVPAARSRQGVFQRL